MFGYYKKFIIIFTVFALLLSLSGCNGGNEARKIVEPEERVATLTLCASNGEGEKVFGLFNFGHAFIVLENNSDEAMDICGFSLPAGHSVTISTWSVTKKFGVWFNVESSLIKAIDKYSDRVAVSCALDTSAVGKLQDYLIAHNSWSVFSNCTVFSVGLFNALVGDENRIDISGIKTPEKLKKQIMRFDTYSLCNPIATDEQIGFLDKNGSYVGGYALEV